MGTRDILSTPPAMTMSMVPDITYTPSRQRRQLHKRMSGAYIGAEALTAWAAKCTACWLEPHCLSIEVAGTDSGRFEASTQFLATLKDCSPACTRDAQKPTITWKYRRLYF